MRLIWILLMGLGGAAWGEFRIVEFLAENDSGIVDGDGERSDWIEVENVSGGVASLGGWALTDDVGDLNSWVFPDVVLGAGESVVVFASGKDRRVAGEELHASFSLDRGGEYLALVRPGGSEVANAFAPEFPAQRADVSYGTGRAVDEDVLVEPSSPGRFLVPSDGALGAAWRDAAFDDGAWDPVTAAVGYQVGLVGGSAGDPQGYWAMDGDVTDGSGQGHDGELTGGGFLNGALDLDGAAAYVSVEMDVSETAFTSSMWFRTRDRDGGLFVVADGELGAGGHDRHVYLQGGNVFVRTWNNETVGSAGLNLADGEWHHVAHVFGGGVGGQRVYVDGALVANGNKRNSDFNWQRRLHIGFSNDAAQNYFDGQIDDVAVWDEALNEGQIGSLAAGASPLALSGVDPLIGTDVEAAMRGRNATGYLRVEFDAPGEDDYDRLEMEVWYDDGFVAYLNGVEVARRNAPDGEPGWDAVAVGDRPVSEAVVGERINLTAHVDSLLHAGNVLAVQVLNDAAGSDSFLFRAEMVAQEVESEVERFFLEPSPGEPNPAGVEDFVADTKFSHDRGYYDEAFEVTVTSATPGARIGWTTDGSKPVPGAAGTTVVEAVDADTGPVATVAVATTTTLRAAAFKDGFEPTNIDTQTYVFAADVARQPARPPGLPATWSGGATADYGMDPDVVNSTLAGYGIEEALLSLPAMSVVSAPGDLFSAASGVYSNSGGRGFAWEREVSVELWYPDGRRDGFQAGAGVRAHGNSSRSHGFTPKHPLRLYFRERYGDTKLRYRIFEDSDVDRFDHLLLRGCSTDSFPVVDGSPRWINDKGTYLRDQYMRDTLRDLGNVSCHGTYVNLYLNGLYWGLYNVAERPIDDFNASYHGGDKEEYDVIKDFAELQEGNRASWDAMMAAVAGGLTSEAAYQRFLGNRPDGTRDPALPVHLHEKSFIDYMITHIAGGAEDWPNHNYWAGRRRGDESEGWYFYAWDQEISNDDLRRDRSVIFPQQPFERVNVGGSPAIVYDRLRRNPTFVQKFRDRVHELFSDGGPMSPEANRARWAARQAEVDLAIVGESARWGDARQHPPIKRETLWMREMNWMQRDGGFWDQNHVRAIRRFRNVGLYPNIDAPTFTRDGGVLPAGGAVSFEAPAEGTIYYTTDGSDPRGGDGSVSGAARAFNGSEEVVEMIGKGAEWRYWDGGGLAGDAWKGAAFDDGEWEAGGAPLGYGDGDEETVVGFGGDFLNRHVTTYFRRAFDVADPGSVVGLSLGVLRDDGAAVYLNGVEVARTNLPGGEVTAETRALSNVTGADESELFYEFAVDPGLLVAGENVLAVEVHQVSPTSGDLSFDLELEARVLGGAGGVRLDGSGEVRARVFGGGEWSGLSSAYFLVGSEPASAENLVVSEVHYHPSEPSAEERAAGFGSGLAFEFLELTNIAEVAVDLAGVRFSEGVEFVFPDGVPVEVAPGGRVLLVADAAAMAERYGDGLPVVGEFAGGTNLANGGERLVLLGRDGEVVKGFEYDDVAPWPVAADGGGASLVLVAPGSNPEHGDAGSWRASGVAGGTPGEGEGAGETLAVLVALAAPVGVVVEDGGRQFAGVRYLEVGGASYLVEVSTDLVEWVEGETVLVEESGHDDGTVTVTRRLVVEGARYLRVRVGGGE